MRLRNPFRRRPTSTEVQQARDDAEFRLRQYDEAARRWPTGMLTNQEYERSRTAAVDARIRVEELEARR